MPRKMLIDATHPEETRVVVVDGNKVEEFDFESAAKRQLAGNIYLAKVTRVEPSLQAAFVDYGGNRHGFLAFSEIHPDYYQIPIADRQALLAEERAYAESLKAQAEAHEDNGDSSDDEDDEDGDKPRGRRRSRSRSRSRAASSKGDAVASKHPEGMETIDLGEDEDGEGDTPEGASPMETVAETPVETPAAGEDDDEDGGPEAPPEKDDTIESVADEDDIEDVRPVRKPRARKYKIQEVVKVRQIMLVQVVKEERGNKGAALTTYLSLAGRYCVLMPNTARGGGISRKITNAVDRKKLKEIAGEMAVPEGAGLIIRTAGSQRTKSEIKRDYEYLQRLWEQIRELTLKSIAPARIYEEGDLIKRSIRDLYSKEIDEVIVEGADGYRTAKDFMKMIMPSHAKNVKPYGDNLPLFARYQVESYLNAMFNPTVQLPSGGYIVIGVTEALVAIDVNSGRATKEGSIEQTALKTNLEAAEEVARQLRLRDLAGLIVIDFIDMDERKNNAAVEKRLKDKLKTDRARIQLGRISGFGLLEMSRQRLRPGMLEATTQPCPHCHGTGLLRSDDNVALSILRQIEEEGVRGRTKEVLVKAPVGIVNYLINHKREHIAQIEARYGMSVRLEADLTLVSPDYMVEKFKTAMRAVPEVTGPVVSHTTAALVADEYDDDADVAEEEADEDTAEAEAGDKAEEARDEQAGDDRPKKKRRRRRRKGRKPGDEANNGENGDESSDDDSDEPATEGVPEPAAEQAEAEAPAEAAEAEEKPKRRRSRTRRKTEEPAGSTETEGVAETVAAAAEAQPEPVVEEKPKRRTRRKKAETEPAPEPAPVAEQSVEAVPGDGDSAGSAAAAVPDEAVTPEPATEPEVAAQAEPEPAAEPEPEAEAEPASAAAAEPEAQAEPEPEKARDDETREPALAEADTSDKPKRRGWWSLGRG
ncbi:Rne/Rng family ribonuclease [Wenxinia marina]|nr:ribonuclease E/G [Wenxinia marina]